MPGRGPTPKVTRRRASKPKRGEWTAAPGRGWQHGQLPAAPEGVMPATLTAWDTWLKAWFAAHWSPDDLPGLRQLIRLYDQVERGEFQRATELRLQMDTYGITPKGQQDRRWSMPTEESAGGTASSPSATPYEHLRVVS